MAKKITETQNSLTYFKHHLIPSTTGGVVAYLFSGILLLALAVFISVWAGNMVSHRIHKK